jgi:succinyl-diaminopimelate desuccinylase
MGRSLHNTAKRKEHYMAPKELLDERIEAVKGNIIADIQQLVGFASINGHTQQVHSCLDHFLARAEAFGFKTMTTTTHDVGIVEMGEGDETIGILVHLDVVEVGERAKWTNDPFECVDHDGFLWGRGVVDDKGAAVMSLYAMKALKDLGVTIQRKVWLIVGTSEESVWTDIASFKREFPLPCCGFSPDGEFPIYNREKGFAEIVLHFAQDAKHGIRRLHGGDSPNTIPAHAEIVLADGHSLSTHGVSAHSSDPERGENAIIKLCKELETMGETELKSVRFICEILSAGCHAEALHIDDGVDTLDGETIGLTTVAPTVITLGDAGVHLTINIRHKYGTTRDDILRAFTARAEEYGYTIEAKEYLDPMKVSKDLPFLNIMKEVSEEYGVNSDLKNASGTSYAKSMANFVSWGPVFPDDPKCAHVEDERLSVSSMMLATKMYARLLQRVAGTEKVC